MGELDNEKHTTDGLAVEKAKPKVKRPPLYQVVLMNDDFTPMEFVVEVLQVFFWNGSTQGNANYVACAHKG